MSSHREAEQRLKQAAVSARACGNHEAERCALDALILLGAPDQSSSVSRVQAGGDA